MAPCRRNARRFANPSTGVITYATFTTHDAEELTRLLGHVFAYGDPPNVAVGLEPAEFEAFVALLCSRAEDEGLTIVARSGESGELVGAVLAEDAAHGPPDGITRLSTKFAPIFDLLGQLDAEYRKGVPVRPGECLHLFLLGVSPRHAGRGVARELVTRALAQGAARGYRRAVTEATNRTSQHVFRTLGFVERVQRHYGDHLFDGRRPFASIAEHGGPILMEKALTP